MSEPVKKIDTLRAHMAAARWREALSLAAKFPRLGMFKEAITRAHEAIQRPEFYRAIGKDPAQLVADGIKALEVHYGKR